MPNKKLYISHAAKDQTLVDALAELLEVVTLPAKLEVFGSAMEETGPPGRHDFASYLKQHREDTVAGIVLLSPSYFTNRFCHCEMGAVMALSDGVFPILVPPLTFQHTRAIFPASQIDKVDNTDDLNRLMERMKKHLGLVDVDLPRWVMKKKRFMGALPDLLS